MGEWVEGETTTLPPAAASLLLSALSAANSPVSSVPEAASADRYSTEWASDFAMSFTSTERSSTAWASDSTPASFAR